MLEVRAYVTSLELTMNHLAKIGASQLSDYAFKDYIYHPKERAYDLNLEFVRLRVFQKASWNQKMVELVHKVKIKQGITGELKLKRQFDKPQEANDFLKSYVLTFSYGRKGKEYGLENLKIFLEDIEGLPPSIEILAPSKREMDTFFHGLPSASMVSDSVPKLIEAKILT